MQIPIRIEQTLGISRPDSPVVAGVPIPRGELTDVGWMTLRHSNGDAWPVHTSPAAYWPDGSVKWLHFVGPISLDEVASHELTLDTAAVDGKALPQLSVQQQGAGVRVTGGKVDVAFGPDVAGWLHASPAADSRGVKVTGLDPVLEYVGAEPGDKPRAGQFVFTDEPAQILVDTANRVVLRATGEWRDEAGEPMAELRLFVEVLGDVAEVRLQPALVYKGQPQRDLVRRFELVVQTDMGAELPSMEHIEPLTDSQTFADGSAPRDPQPIDSITYGFGEQQGRGYWDQVRPFVHLARYPIARQVQVGSSFYRTEKRVLPTGCSWVKANEGQRAQGWCHLSQDGAGLTAAMRYYWQEYPSSLAVDAEQGTLAFGFWPEAVQPLDFRRYSPMRYGKDSYEYRHGTFPEETHGAYGVGKAREFVLQFHDQPVETREQRLAVARRALSFTQPLRPMTTPAHLAATQVVGRVAAIDIEHDQRPFVQRMSQYMDLLSTERDSRGWYGMIDFGDILVGYYSNLDRWGFDDGGYGWINTEHLPDYGLWLAALTTGRSDWYNMAIEMSRHNRDLDTYHAGQFIGSGTRHNVNHWGCADKEWRVTNPISRRLHYFTTADPWTREVILESVTMFQTYDRTSSLAPSMAAALSGVLAKWEMSGSEADGQVVRNMTDVYADGFAESGTWYRRVHVNIATGEGEAIKEDVAWSYFFFETFGCQHTLEELVLLLDHKQLSDALVRYARFRFNPGEDKRAPGLGPAVAQAHAWHTNRDQECLERIRESLAAQQYQLHTTGGSSLDEEPVHMAPVECLRRNKFGCHLGQYLMLAPYAIHALNDADGT